MDELQTELTAGKNVAVKTSKVRQYNGAIITAIIALLLAIAMTLAALVYVHNLNALLGNINNNTQLLHRQMQQLQGIQTTLMTRLDHQQQQLAKNQQLTTGNQKAWLMAEINYLVRLANYNLSYGRDVAAAIALLQTADQRFVQLNDPALISLRQQIANMIVSLQPAAKMDLVGILAKLAALQLQVKQLPLITSPTFDSAKTAVNLPAQPPQTFWRKALANSLELLKSLVIIRHHQASIEPLLDVEQLHYLQQNLQLQLQQAQWAVLHGQQAIYENSLQQTITGVQTYFASANPQTTAFIENLMQLQKINIQPALPTMNALLNSLAQAEHPAAKPNQ